MLEKMGVLAWYFGNGEEGGDEAYVRLHFLGLKKFGALVKKNEVGFVQILS